MATLVQTLPQQASPISLLPSSSPSTLVQQSQMARNQQPHARVATAGGASRVSSQPVSSYAFTSTPSLNTPQARPNPSFSGDASSRYHAAAGSISTTASSESSTPSRRSKDDSALPSAQPRPRAADNPARPLSLSIDFNPPPDLSFSPSASQAKPSPVRYRNRRPEQNTSSFVATGISSPPIPRHEQAVPAPEKLDSPLRVPSDDVKHEQPRRKSELAKRYRRRSVASFGDGAMPDSNGEISQHDTDLVPEPSFDEDSLRPRSSNSSHTHNGSADSVATSHSSSSVKREPVAGVSRNEQRLHTLPHGVDIPKRVMQPSPLSKPTSVEAVPPSPTTSTPIDQSNHHPPPTDEKPPASQTPAMERLAELSKKHSAPKTGKSRLRRALSFGSAAELRAMDEAAAANEALRKQQLNEELGAEQAAIAEQQEAAGLGESIYAQNRFFGSNDNLSISSTASSASLMLRKMGKGVKRTSRSFVGLFRQKSTRHLAAEPSVVPMTPQVSMVTVEAERAPVELSRPIVNVPAVPATGRTSDTDSGISNMRFRGPVGDKGDKEKEKEIPAATRRGILKRTTTAPLPARRPTDSGVPQLPLPTAVDSPTSSAPSTPAEDQSHPGHRRTDTVAIEGEEYFMAINRLNVPESQASKAISFSPRIQFYDTWCKAEYDRRGETPTSARLTPLLAQQIKEELNSLKMEMEVHEQSKEFTHFF